MSRVALMLMFGFVVIGTSRSEATCTTLPPITPTKGFVANFSNSCYALQLITSNGSSESGDLDALYSQVYYQVTPGYALIILGSFPNARYLAATVYDDHLVPVSTMADSAILPLTSGMINPLLPGATYKPNQTYGLTISFGGGQPTAVSPGCSTAATNIDKNLLDASQLHQGLSWTGYPNLPPGFPAHETGANAAGVIFIRKYIDMDSPPLPEYVMVRSLANGCAIPIQQAIQSNIVSVSQNLTSTWLHQTEINAHMQFSRTIQPWLCFPPDPLNSVLWQGAPNYVPVANTDAGYLNTPFSTAQIQNLLSGQTYLRIQFQIPTTPTTPCVAPASCSFSGNEQTRYFGLSFPGPMLNVAGPMTLSSIGDENLVKDPNGNVTVVVGFGTPQPPNVTAANYYTWIDLSTVPNYSSILGLRIRNVAPNPSFQCSTFNVPPQTSEYNPAGGYMGPYVPTVDFPTASQIPVLPTPVSRPNSCSAVPTQTPQICTTAPLP